jgi:glycosyltransferase involved in cell wall biosynthesis
VFSSTIIPTIGRSTLMRAVDSVLQQSLPPPDDFEVIVVNDSGEPLPAARWQADARVRVIETQRHERSVARNTGAAIARGTFLHFLDDDDWLLPDALRRMSALARAYPRADWLYGGSSVTDRHARPIVQLRHGLHGNAFVQVMAGEWIPLQASFIRAESFFAVGGFTPNLSGPEDIDVCRRVLLRGEVAGTAALVACIAMGRDGSSTDYDRHAAASRAARERILDQPGVLGRFHQSASERYWRGRILRAYLTSALWNAQHRRGFTAASRLAFAGVSLLRSGPSVLAVDFWSAVWAAYASRAFERGLRARGGELDAIPRSASGPAA